MPHWVRLCLILAMAVWGVWYFPKILWVAFRTGRIIDGKPYDGIPVTRSRKPIAYWFSVIVSAVMTVLMPYLLILIIGDLAGFWESYL